MRFMFASVYIFSCCACDQSHLAQMLEPQTISGSTGALAKGEEPTVDATSESPASNAAGADGDDESGVNASAVAVADGKDRNDVGNGSAVAAANGDNAGADITGGGVESSDGAAGTRARLTNGVFAFTLHLADGGYLQLAYGDKARSPYPITIADDTCITIER